MHWIALSHPHQPPGYSIEQEAEVLCSLLDLGFVRIHLRKPHANRYHIEKTLELMAPEFRKRTVVHGFPELKAQWGTWGCHDHFTHFSLLHATPDPLTQFSTSIHNLEELSSFPNFLRSLFVSPIFPSFSKPGYSRQWDFTKLQALLNNYKNLLPHTHFVALGGITPDHAAQIENLGFSHAAVLGYIWEDSNPLQAAKRCLNHEV